MAETKTEISQNRVAEIAKEATGNASLDGSVKRATRDSIITKELELIKNAAGDDRTKYIERVLSISDKVISDNKDALAKLKQLRSDPNSNPDEIKKLFDENPKLLEARAYLILAASFGDSSKYAEYLDSDGSTLKMIELLSEKAKQGLADADATKGLNQIHDASISLVEEQLSLILNYIKSQSSKPDIGSQKDDPKQGAQSQPDPNTTPDSNESQAQTPPAGSEGPKTDAAQGRLDYDPSKIANNVTAKAILGNNYDTHRMWYSREDGANTTFNSQVRFIDNEFGNKNTDGKTSYIRGDGKPFLKLSNPTDLISSARTTPEMKDDNYIAPDYSNLGIYRIGQVRIHAGQYNKGEDKNETLDKALQEEIRRFLRSDEKVLPLFLIKPTGKGWLMDGVEGAVVYLPRNEVIKQLGLGK